MDLSTLVVVSMVGSRYGCSVVDGLSPGFLAVAKFSSGITFKPKFWTKNKDWTLFFF